MPPNLNINQKVYLARLDGNTTKIEKTGVSHVEFKSDHEEADSKMFSYCKFVLSAHTGIDRLIIDSPNTDVAVICCYQHASSLSNVLELWFRTGVGKKKRFIPIHSVCKKLGLITKVLPAVHVVTGCDSVSSFSGIGKKTAYKTLKEKMNQFKDLEKFGDSPILSLDNDSVVASARFVCNLYDSSDDIFNVNELRYKLYAKKGLTTERLPLTLDSLLLHLKRGNYQCFIWKYACNSTLSLPSPVGNGWIKQEGRLDIDLVVNKPVPEIIAKLVRCCYKKGCKSNSCRCQKAKLPCTDACLCSDECENNDENKTYVSSDEEFDEE